jgi:hypothetical protein
MSWAASGVARSFADLSQENIDPGHIAARPRKALDQTEPDRVLGNNEDDGDRRGRFGRHRRDGTTGRDNDGDPSANQVGRQRRQPIHLVVSEAIFDRDVFTLDVAAVLETLPKCARTVRGFSRDLPRSRGPRSWA